MIYIIMYNRRIFGTALSLERAKEMVESEAKGIAQALPIYFYIYRCELGEHGSIHMATTTVYCTPLVSDSLTTDDETHKVYVEHTVVRRDGCNFDAVMEHRELAALVLKNDPQALDLMNDMLGVRKDRCTH